MDLKNKSFLIVAGSEYEDLELWYPKLRLEEAGAKTLIIAEEAEKLYSGKHGYPCVSEEKIEMVKTSDYDGIILPGGWMPDKVRRNPSVLKMIREMDREKKLIAAICHGGWLAISAGVYSGVTVTGSRGIKDDLENAGAQWSDDKAVRDGHHVSAQRPPDLPAFMLKIFEFYQS